MTTIAYKDYHIAADGLVSVGDTIISTDETKIHEIIDSHGNIYIVGVAGRLTTAQKLLNHIAKNQLNNLEKLKINEYDLKAIIFTKSKLGSKKLWFFDCDKQLMELSLYKYHAIGSGANFALGAMAVDAEAIDAVKASSLHDAFTGGKTKEINLGVYDE